MSAWTVERPGTSRTGTAITSLAVGAISGAALAWALIGAGTGRSEFALALLVPVALLIGWSNATSP